jgi:TolA-binding protein
MSTRLRSFRIACVLGCVSLASTGCGISLNPARLWSKKTPTSIDRYDIAKRHYTRGEYSAAIKGFSGWLRDFPKDPLEPAALYYLAASYKKNRDSARAKATYERIVTHYADTQWAEFAKQDLERVDTPEAAVPKYKSKRHWWNPADWFTPDPPSVRAYKSARKHYTKKRYEQAIAGFRLVATRYAESPLAPAAWYFVARSYEQLDQKDTAREGYERVVRDYPKTDWEALAAEDLKRLGAS